MRTAHWFSDATDMTRECSLRAVITMTWVQLVFQSQFDKMKSRRLSERHAQATNAGQSRLAPVAARRAR